MNTVLIDDLLRDRELPRCIKFKVVGGGHYTAVRRKKTHFAAQRIVGVVGDATLEEHTIAAGTPVEVADDAL